MSYINLCSPIYDQLQDQSMNLRVTRILFGIDLLLLCIIYICVSFLIKKDINSLKLEDKASNQGKIQLLERRFKKWENQFLLSFGDHVVSIGFVMTFSPFAFQLVLAGLFLLLKLIYEIRIHKVEKDTKQLKTCTQIINMSLLLCAMVGLSRMSFGEVGNCHDTIYQLV